MYNDDTEVPYILSIFSLRFVDISVPISWPQKGDIIFENVSIRYVNQQENVITKLYLKIEAGQRVGYC